MLSSAHHLFEGRLYDSHHQTLQTNHLLHVEAHRRVADGVGVLWILGGPFLRVRLVRAAVLGQADGRRGGGILQQVADFPEAVSDEAVKEFGGHDGGPGPRVSVKHPPEVERNPCAILQSYTDVKMD